MGPGLQEQAAAPGPVPRTGERNSVSDCGVVSVPDDLVENPADLADVAGDLRRPLLRGVQLLQHDHGQVHVVLLEPEQGGGVLHENVGVQYVEHVLPPSSHSLSGKRI